MESLEGLEEAIGPSGIESCSIVAHKVDLGAAAFVDAKLDSRAGVMRGVFPGICAAGFQSRFA